MSKIPYTLDLTTDEATIMIREIYEYCARIVEDNPSKAARLIREASDKVGIGKNERFLYLPPQQFKNA